MMVNIILLILKNPLQHYVDIRGMVDITAAYRFQYFILVITEYWKHIHRYEYNIDENNVENYTWYIRILYK